VQVYELKEGQLREFRDRFVPLSESSGFDTLLDFYRHKRSTIPLVLIFPYWGLWPLGEPKAITGIPLEIENDNRLVFWPREIVKYSRGRDKDIVIGNTVTTTISYMEEIKGFLLNTYPSCDYCFYVLATDIHYRRVKRDFQTVFRNCGEEILFIPHIIKIRYPVFSKRWWLKLIFWIREAVMVIIFLPNYWYYNASLRKGGLK